MTKTIGTFILLCSLAGCMHVTYTSRAPRASHSTTGTNHFFLWGLASTGQVDVYNTCPAGAAKVVLGKSFVDGLLEMLTAGLYSPRSYEIWCAAPTGDDTVAAVVHGEEDRS